MLAYNIEEKKVQIETFDGPLELLLYLINKEGVSILEVPIAKITDAYLAHIKTMDLLNLNTAGDFLFMASTLCFLKCKELLKLPDEEEPTLIDEDDPVAIKNALHLQLINYVRCKEASIELGKRHMLGREIFARPVHKASSLTLCPKTSTDAMGLLKIFQTLLYKTHQATTGQHIEKAKYSLKEMSIWVLEALLEGTSTLYSLLEQQSSLPDRIVCFLSVLELARLNHVDFTQDHHLASIHLIPNYTSDIPEVAIYELESSEESA